MAQNTVLKLGGTGKEKRMGALWRVVLGLDPPNAVCLFITEVAEARMSLTVYCIHESQK
jgi:hypothetical protein